MPLTAAQQAKLDKEYVAMGGKLAPGEHARMSSEKEELAFLGGKPDTFAWSSPTPAPATPSKPTAPSTEGKYKVVTVKVISDDNPNASRGAKLKVPAGMFVPTTIRNKDFIKRYSGFENKYIESNNYYKQSSSDTPM